MTTPLPRWQCVPETDIPADWVDTVGAVAGLDPRPVYGARLLWQRGIRTTEQLRGFLDPAQYQPTSPAAFGAEMESAIERLVQARQQAEKVTIWGDFDADGITSTAVLWEGLGQFFKPHTQLSYVIPNRLTESHGLSGHGLDQLAAQGVQLVVTCDTGSTNLTELDYARQLGLDVIVTDHHTLPPERPPIVAMINPRTLPADHPLAHLSGVAVAFKLVEALYDRLPTVPQRPLSALLDLVAIGLIADLVQLTGDCRYLAQRGIQHLQQHLKADQDPAMARPGVARLLELCRRTGDRPTDISFGLGPRINAVSRIHGDASFCVELLTSQDAERCRALATQTELANARRKALQKDVLQQVTARLAAIDLATTGVIVLADAQWPIGVLGIVAGQVAQTYGKPTILFTLDEAAGLARGSARSVNQINLYQLLAEQAHLLTGFGGHPLAAGMSLPLENLSVFSEAINRQLRQQPGLADAGPVVQVDLTVMVQDLGRGLFKQLSLLEPCGMGNPPPKLLIRNCWFENVWHQKLRDPGSDRKLQYIKATFLIRDDSTDQGFPGVWWDHYKEDLPPGRWDAIAELDFNSYAKQKQRHHDGYEIRLVDIRPATTAPAPRQPTTPWLIDQRPPRPDESAAVASDLVLQHCPAAWPELRPWMQQALQSQQPLVLAYPPPAELDLVNLWKQLLGLAKYLRRTGETITLAQLQQRFQLGDTGLAYGLEALQAAGFTLISEGGSLRFSQGAVGSPAVIQRFLQALQEEHFRRTYFYQVSLATAQAVLREGGSSFSVKGVDNPVAEGKGQNCDR